MIEHSAREPERQTMLADSMLTSRNATEGVPYRNEAMSDMDSVYSATGASGGFSAPSRNAGQDYELAQRLAHLPPYARSLLRIQVPLIVTLASTRQATSRVLDLAPGAILHFAKPCDEAMSV